MSVSLQPAGVPAVLQREIEQLRRVLSRGGADRPSTDRLRQAVLRFLDTGELPDFAATRAVCFGVTERFDRAPLIEDRERFPRVLDGADRYRPEPRRFRRCYRGLLHAYFAYDGERADAPTSGRRNWSALRDYLHERRRDTRVEGFRPEWSEAIDEHPNLLTDTPVDRYGPDLLEDRTEVVDQIRKRLEISDTSWLMRHMVLARIAAAVREPDAQFRKRVQPLLALLKGHELLEDEGLTLILNRYSRIAGPELHTGLRDRSVECWGNPWLERNTPKWSRVAKEARALITTWLKIDLINEFFEVLAEDRGTDKRRVKFWLKYHESIRDMYFALGPHTLTSRAADTRRLRDKMGDHLVTLLRPGNARNNAFIMMIGEYVIVEFGVTGNATYIFRSNALPFELGGSVAGDGTGLKHADHVERLVHISGHEDWEEKFADTLARLGIRAGASASGRPAATPARPPARATNASSDVIRAFLRGNGIEWTDNTARNGIVKVFHPRGEGGIAAQLDAWGFEYSSERKFWWRREPV